MLLRLIAITVLSCSIKIVYAQNYVVSLKGDTLRGKTKIESIDNNHRVVVVSPEKKRASLTILKTKAVHIDGEKFEPVLLGGRYVFMKLIQEGYLSLYAFQIEKQLSYDGRYLLKKDRQGLELPNLGFKRAMGKFLAECPSVIAKIEAGTLTRNKVTQIVDDYNECIRANSAAKPVEQSTPIVVIDANKLKNWVILEDNINNSALANKVDLLEMVAEIKTKITRGEKIPKFLLDGLRNGVQESSDLMALLDVAVESK